MERIGIVGRWMFRLGVLWLAMIPVLFIVSFAYDAVTGSRDMNLPGLLAAASLVYFFLKPLGAVLLVLGFLLRHLGDG